jgi:hypothetical protein
VSLKQELGDWILGLPGVALKASRFGGGSEAFYVGSREFAHFHAGNEIDLRVTRAAIRPETKALAADRKATLRGGDWVEYRFPRRTDLDRVMELARFARDANA